MQNEELLPDADHLVEAYIQRLDVGALSEFALIGSVDEELQPLALATAQLVLRAHPSNARMKLIRAYLVWELLELDLLDAEVLTMQTLIQANIEVGAAGIMLDRLVRRASWSDDHEARSPQPPDVVDALQRSVEAQPEWVDNHIQLAIALAEVHDRDGALQHRDIAVANSQGIQGAGRMTYVERAWAIAFTGVLKDPNSLASGFGMNL